MKTKIAKRQTHGPNNVQIRRKPERTQGDSAFLGRPKQVHAAQARAADVRALARRATDAAVEASIYGLDTPNAVVMGALHVAFDAQMTHLDFARWLRSLADGFEAERKKHAARVRAALRRQAAERRT